MAISSKAAQNVLTTLTIAPGQAAKLVALASTEGWATGTRSDGPMCGILVTVHHAGNSLFIVEVH